MENVLGILHRIQTCPYYFEGKYEASNAYVELRRPPVHAVKRWFTREINFSIYFFACLL